ncbi:MAG TPA: class I SAM-dependent methyltransferase [Desulfobacteraceae bacterium]|nr:class I SAM-dependent methyltransferase [Desulfobacteraceae bacterium]
MGLIFDKNINKLYESWYQTPQGRIIDKSIEWLIKKLLDPRPGERILDIGCGTGNHLIIFNKLGLDLTGIDASPNMVDKARLRLGQRCTFKTGRAEDLPFDDNEFDFAVFINSLEFLDDPLQALKEAGRVTNKKVFIGVINSISWTGLRNKIQGCMGNNLFNNAKFYNLWQLKSLLKRAYGPVPISWCSIKKDSTLLENMYPFSSIDLKAINSPFSPFLGMSARIVYKYKTDNLLLRSKLKKTRQSLVGVRTLGDLNRTDGAYKDERSLPL